MKSGVGDILGEVAGQSSGNAGKVLNLYDKGYEQLESTKEIKSQVDFILHLAHRNNGID